MISPPLHTYLAAAWSGAGADNPSVVTLGAFCQREASGKKMKHGKVRGKRTWQCSSPSAYLGHDHTPQSTIAARRGGGGSWQSLHKVRTSSCSNRWKTQSMQAQLLQISCLNMRMPVNFGEHILTVRNTFPIRQEGVTLVTSCTPEIKQKRNRIHQ